MTISEKVPPHSTGSEKALLGAILHSSEIVDEVLATGLLAEDLYHREHQEIFSAMMRLHSKNIPIDLVTVTDQLRDDGKLDSVGSAVYITSLLEAVPFSANWQWYCQEIRKNSTTRKQASACQAAAFALLEGHDATRELAAVRTALNGPAARVEVSTLIEVKDLRAKPKQEYRWLIDGRLLIAGFAIVAGRPKAGKSTLIRSLAMAVAQRRPWLGFSIQQSSVVILALEENEAELQREFDLIDTVEGRAPIHLHVAPAPLEPLPWLKRIIEQYKPGLVVIDPYFRFARVKDANDYSVVTPILEALITIAHETGTCIVIVHHLRKAIGEGDESVLGSTAITAAVDTVFMIQTCGQVPDTEDDPTLWR